MNNENSNLSLNIAWLFPEHMSTYGDRGNITVLYQRLKWRNIDVRITPIRFETNHKDLENSDLVFGGGAQDRQQTLVAEDLRRRKGSVLKSMFEKGVPGLFVCGSPQLFGRIYTTGNGEKITGVGILPIESYHPGEGRPRLIGNLVFDIGERFRLPGLPYRHTVVGFENHGGRTYLDREAIPLGKVICGSGNNGEDGLEGVFWHNCLATYSHGPLLSKNPHLADWLIFTALRHKYSRKFQKLTLLEDQWEWQAHDFALHRFLKKR
jgi:hypothetical protein